MSAQRPADGLVDTARAATLLGVPRARIEDWKHRGRVTPAGTIPGRGRGGMVPLYRLEELRPLAEAYLRSKGHDTPEKPASG